MSRKTVHQEVESIKHDIDTVWNVVSDFPAVTTWIPSVSHCTVQGEGIGSIRTVTQAGMSFQEQLEFLDSSSHTISYRILDPTPFPMTGFHGTIHLERLSAGTTRLTWTADAESVDDEGMKVVGPVMDQFIKTSIAGLEANLSHSHSAN
ncbi:hypothetical protein EDB81DRAFT_831519 [Dactylonectria macrodidyma]|uniref:Uncharacterized protein n=1 Tax=Dactylonectria macrodidyma TaxID=307937 RepID=A0A9P9I7G7_9HYPO|nr:hypothetical protein EDB81DRAFT_831519 [Dactylonectria macrodidyma]